MKTLAIAILVALTVASPAFAIQFYSVTAVGPAGSDADGINNLGNVVGSTPNGGVTDPFMWTPGGGLHDLGTLGGTSVARAINDNNWVVGQSDGFAFRWTAGAGLVELNASGIADTNYGDARGINSSNTIIGGGDEGVQEWTGGSTHPAALAPGTNSLGYGVNDSNVFVAQLYPGPADPPSPGSGFFQAGSYNSGLGSLLPEAINDPNLIVGTGGGVAMMFDWTTHLSTTIGTLNHTDTSSEAFAINSLNQVVGVSTGTGAFLWDNVNGIQNLSQMLAPASTGWTILSGNGINNNGQIVGLGQFGGQQYAVLLTPVPEPSSVVLFVLGITGLALAARRRR